MSGDGGLKKEITMSGDGGLGKEWTTIFDHPDERQLAGWQALLTTLPRIGTEWRVAFKFKPTTYNGFSRLTLDLQNFLKIQFYPNYMNFEFKHQPYAAFHSKQLTHILPQLGEWTLIEVDQHQVSRELHCFLFKISIGGIQIHTENFQHCQDFANVQVNTCAHDSFGLACLSTVDRYGRVGSIKDMVIKTNLQSLTA